MLRSGNARRRAAGARVRFTAVFPGSHPISVGDAIVGHATNVVADVEDGTGGAFALRPSIVMTARFERHQTADVLDILEKNFHESGGGDYAPAPEVFIRIGDRLVQVDPHVTNAGSWGKLDAPVTVGLLLRVRDASRQLAVWTQPALRALGATVNA
jgi:hypothetical protein